MARVLPGHIAIVVTLFTVSFLVLLPVGTLLLGTFREGMLGDTGPLTLTNYYRVYSDPFTYLLFGNSLVYALGGTAVSLVLGFTLAWIVSRTNIPMRGILEVTAIIPYMMPGILFVSGWILLASPYIGAINTLLRGAFGLPEPLVNIYSLAGMIWLDGIMGIPLVFLIVSASLRSMDSSLEEAAIIAGSTVWATMRRITLPMMRPAILAVLVLSFVRSLESFEIPLIIGMPAGVLVFTTQIYREMRLFFPPNHGLGATYSLLLLSVSLILVYVYMRFTRTSEKFITITGKGYRPGVLEIGKWRYIALLFCIAVLFFAAIMPFAMLAIVSTQQRFVAPTFEMLGRSSLDQYAKIFEPPVIRRAFLNSFFLALVGATLCMLLSSMVSYITLRTKIPGRRLLEAVSFMPFSFPGIVVAVGLLWAYVGIPGVYGTIWLLLLAYITRFIPYGLRATSSTMVQIHSELEDMSRVSGASWLETFGRVTLPLLRRGFMAGWIFLAIIFLREMPASILLYTVNIEVFSVVVYTLLQESMYEFLSAVGIVMTLATIAMVAAAMKISKTRLVSM